MHGADAGLCRQTLSQGQWHWSGSAQGKDVPDAPKSSSSPSTGCGRKAPSTPRLNPRGLSHKLRLLLVTRRGVTASLVARVPG